MKTPFVFGRIARDENFTDREKETLQLRRNFTSLVNTIIISPRRWGKSSLVVKAAEETIASDNRIRICHVDLFNIRNEEQFYETLALSVLKSTSTKWDEAVGSAKKFFRQLAPKIVLSTDPGSEFSLSFDWKELKQNPDEVLDLPQKIASDKKLKVIICIDEFQNLREFDDPLYLQKRLRSHWQQHRDVAYCLYGSKRHMMLDVFTNPSMPFYKFGEIMFLEKIDTASWIGFITERFGSTGKQITEEEARLIVTLTDNHPYYVQQLSQQSWLRSIKRCSVATIYEAHHSLVAQLSLLFATLTESLTSNQINLLKAIIEGEKALSSADVISKYRLGSSSNVNRSRQSLIEKDILDSQPGSLTFQDPLYRFWLREYFFV